MIEVRKFSTYIPKFKKRIKKIFISKLDVKYFNLKIT